MLPLTTSTFTLTTYTASDPYEAPVVSSTVTGIPGHLSSPSPRDQLISSQTINYVLYLPPNAPADRAQTVTDEKTGETYNAVWAHHRQGLGLDHKVIGVTRTKGAAV